MKNTYRSSEHDHQTGRYEIRLQGHLDDQWAEWFEGLAITLEDCGQTLIAGPVVDQTALHGLLKKVRDLGMPLISVVRAAHRQPDAPDEKQDKGHEQSIVEE